MKQPTAGINKRQPPDQRQDQSALVRPFLLLDSEANFASALFGIFNTVPILDASDRLSWCFQ
jgi:hypothetical protein